MSDSSNPKQPAVLSYFALRRAVGYIALCLPFALSIPWWLMGNRAIRLSVSSYYYTDMRNVLVGGLCAISVFMLCFRGYDRRDRITGIFCSVCVLGVAFFPTVPDSGATEHQRHLAIAHYTFATLLFSALVYFCFVLFKSAEPGRKLTPRKLQRNRVYTICGWAIILSMVGIAVLKGLDMLGLAHFEGIVVHFHTTFWFESTSMIAFGVAWLTKGQAFLKDEAPARVQTADRA